MESTHDTQKNIFFLIKRTKKTTFSRHLDEIGTKLCNKIPFKIITIPVYIF